MIENSRSLLLPAMYTLKNKEIGSFLLASYYVGHQKLFNKGDFVSLEAPIYKTRRLKCPIVIVPVQGLWIEKKPSSKEMLIQSKENISKKGYLIPIEIQGQAVQPLLDGRILL